MNAFHVTAFVFVVVRLVHSRRSSIHLGALNEREAHELNLDHTYLCSVPCYVLMSTTSISRVAMVGVKVYRKVAMLSLPILVNQSLLL